METGKKKMKTGASGPVSVSGKSRSSMNAVRHGALSDKVLLQGESRPDFDALLRELALDLQPVGAIENILVEKMAAILWRSRRLHGAEQDTITSIHLKSVTHQELKDALGLQESELPECMLDRSAFTMEPIKELPLWLLDQRNVPEESEGLHAEAVCAEWEAFQDSATVVENEEDAKKEYPAMYTLLTAEINDSEHDGDVLSFLSAVTNNADFDSGFRDYIAGQYEAHYWVAYWHQNRDKMAAAFRAIRAKRMLAEWDIDRAHRYHTMLDNQFFKLMREYRETRSWRLANLQMANDDNA